MTSARAPSDLCNHRFDIEAAHEFTTSNHASANHLITHEFILIIVNSAPQIVNYMYHCFISHGCKSEIEISRREKKDKLLPTIVSPMRAWKSSSIVQHPTSSDDHIYDPNERCLTTFAHLVIIVQQHRSTTKPYTHKRSILHL